MSEEDEASWISVEESTEKESLIEELVEKEDTIQAKAESASKQKFKDNENAEDFRQQQQMNTAFFNVVEKLLNK